ncbi:MAG: hypothetical protein HND58_05735 [Planctomycetota bacterium]|nr:MAG: hypothetical protein HND58_05735 [Planctomycetota bacterium]
MCRGGGCGDDGDRRFAARVVECCGRGVVWVGGEVGEGVSGLGDGLGGDELVAGGCETLDGGEAGAGPVGGGPGFELFDGEFGVFADVEDGERAVEEEAEEEGGVGDVGRWCFGGRGVVGGPVGE